MAGVGAAAPADERQVGQVGAQRIVDLLRPALAARRPDLDVDLDALADHLYTTFEGGFILCRTVGETSAMRGQLRVFRQLVESLLRLDGPA